MVWYKKWYKKNGYKVRARTNQWRKDHPLQFRNQRVAKYGITEAERLLMLLEQDERCLICNIQSEKLVIDHDHITNKVRGMLCATCNCILGFAKDNPILLQKAIEYLGNNASTRQTTNCYSKGLEFRPTGL